MSKEAKALFIAVYLLVSFGIVMTYSASAVYAEQVFKSPTYFLYRQILYGVVGTGFLFLGAGIEPSLWKEHARELLILSLLLLVGVLLPVIGHEAGGARRWIRIGPLNFQPVEIAKLSICLYLSDYLSRRMKEIQKGEFLALLPPLLVLSFTCGLILLQPDLGSTVFIFLIASILFFLSGIRMRFVLLASLVFVPIFYFLVVRIPYRLARVTSYLNPWNDPQGSGFQIIQSLLAFGLGGVRGVGLGEGAQKLFYLPQSYNDFIFSIIGEEMGLIGTVCILVLYSVILTAGIRIANRARTNFEKLFVTSLVSLIVVQALINMLVATGLIPTKGLPLPFVSYGGTSLVFNLFGVGVLLALDRGIQGGRNAAWKRS